MKWTNRKPSRPGWYFWRYDNRSGAVVVWICKLKRGLHVDGGDSGTGMISEWRGQWAGPIPEPKD